MTKSKFLELSIDVTSTFVIHLVNDAQFLVQKSNKFPAVSFFFFSFSF